MKINSEEYVLAPQGYTVQKGDMILCKWFDIIRDIKEVVRVTKTMCMTRCNDVAESRYKIEVGYGGSVGPVPYESYSTTHYYVYILKE